MTNHEAYNLIKRTKYSIRDYKLLVAVDMALQALTWQSTNEMMKKEQNENKHI